MSTDWRTNGDVAVVQLDWREQTQISWPQLAAKLARLPAPAKDAAYVYAHKKGFAARADAWQNAATVEWNDKLPGLSHLVQPPLACYVPALWHLRPGARKGLLGESADLARANDALQALLRTWRDGAREYGVLQAEGFWWLALMLQLHWADTRNGALWRLCEAALERHTEWVRWLLRQSPLRHFLSRLPVMPAHVRLLEPAEIEPLRLVFPADAPTEPWLGAPFEEAGDALAERHAVLVAGEARAPARLLLAPVLEHAAQQHARRVLTQLPWPELRPGLLATRRDGPLWTFYRYWWPRVVGVLLPALTDRVGTWGGDVEELPPCARLALEKPQRWPNHVRTQLWAVLLSAGVKPAQLEARLGPALVRLYGGGLEGQRQLKQEYRKEWLYWERRVQQNPSHPGPSCAQFQALQLCPVGQCARCVSSYVLRDLEDLAATAATTERATKSAGAGATAGAQQLRHHPAEMARRRRELLRQQRKKRGAPPAPDQ